MVDFCIGRSLVTITGQLKWIIFPLLVRGIGVLSSIVGTYLVKGKKDGKKQDALSCINLGFRTSAAISIVAFFFLAIKCLPFWITHGLCATCLSLV